MKRIIFIAMLIIGVTFGVQSRAGRVAIFQAGYWFDFPEETIDSKVEGVKLGLPICSGNGPVEGLELSFFCSATKEVSGLQWSFVGASICEKMHGGQLSLFNVAYNKMEGNQVGIFNIAEEIAGTQLGLINYSERGVQLGFLNINKNGFLPICVLFNMSVK